MSVAGALGGRRLVHLLSGYKPVHLISVNSRTIVTANVFNQKLLFSFNTKPTLVTKNLTIFNSHSHALSTAPPNTEDESKTRNLDEVANLLALDLTNVFLKKINMDLYDMNVVLEDRIRGQSFENILLYIKNMHLLKIVAHMKFIYVRPKILDMTLHDEDNTIRVAWKIVGLGMTRAAIRYFPDKLWKKENMDKAAVPWFEGHSIFYVSSEGKILRHVVDKRTEEENKETVEQMRKKVRPSQFKI